MQKSYYQRKTVQITLYVMKPRKGKKVLTKTERRAGHRHQPPRHAGDVYDRKAELLLYSRQLRATASLAKKASSYKPQTQHKVQEVLQITSIHSPNLIVKQTSCLQISTSRKSQHKAEEDLRITSSHNPQQKVKEVRQINPAFPWKVVPVEHKTSQPKLPRPPTSCFGDWKKIFLPAFCVRKGGGAPAKKDKRKKKMKKKISVSLSDKMNAIMMSSRMEKERIGVMAKFLSAFGKRR